MKTKDIPLTIWLSVISLGSFAFLIAVSSSSYDLSFWYRWSSQPLPLQTLGAVVIYSVFPLLAVIDLLRRRTVGRYLAILSLLIIAARMFRFFVDKISFPPNQRPTDLLPVMTVFSLSISLAALALSLGSSKRVTAYFSSERLT